jgi:iron complex outermembrane receptor protein
MNFFCALFLSFFTTFTFAQKADTTDANTLSTIEVKAYGQVRKLKDVPAAVGYVGMQTLNRYSTGSVVQAVNTVAGVRMEERSPGSYRLNIRGSSLRSPFGVRNVKVYFNDLPITDPGGNTYLNGLGYYNFGSIEILKGPGSSLYGAGTGGVLLIESLPASAEANVFGEYTTGSYGLRNAYASVTTGNSDNKSSLGFQHQVSDGYRYHSALKRDVLSWTGNFHLNEKQALKTTFLYSNHFYETPGALTLKEYETNPKLARPAAGGFPSAEQAKAAITQKTFLAGLSFTQQISANLSNQSTAYGSFTELRNPTIRNYSKSTEPHVGGRTFFTYKQQLGSAALNLNFGGELQQSFNTSTVYQNKNGVADTLQTEDDIRIRQSFVFLQANLSLQGWELTAGGSLNYSTLYFRRTAPAPLPEQTKTLSNQLTPRLAIARKFSGVTLYTSISKGFSPPTAGELLPTGSAINLSLQAEQGVNYDLGARGQLAKNLSFDVNAFYLRLKNTIIQQRDAGGGDFYINAGTAQKGVETSLQYSFLQNSAFFRQAEFWLSHTYHHFRYRDTVQLTREIYGKALPDVAPHTLSTGIDFFAKNGLFANVTYFYSGKIPLNDANTNYADPYHLLGAKIGFEKLLSNKEQLKFVLGADNLLDQHYSLGNDINAFGGRYYNAAPGRNYYASISVQLFAKK